VPERPEQPAAHQGKPESGAAAPAGAEVRTVLIADIRGYTTYTGEQGDEAAARLAERFAEITGAVVAERSGQLVELRGDEALAVFSSTRQALRAALDLQARYAAADLPRGVGIGLDAGEAVRVGDGYRGSALNLAARLCSLAGAGEILASDAVVHLASTVEGIGYASPRTVRVKGFAEPVRAVRVVAATGAARPPGRRAGVPVSGRRLALLGAALAGAAVGIAVLVSLGMDRPQVGDASPTPSSSPAAAAPPYDGPGLAFLDPETGEPMAERLDVGSAVEVEYAEGAFWVLGFDPPALYRIDPATHGTLTTIPIAFGTGSFLVDGTTVWFTDYEVPQIHRFDAISGRPIGEPLPVMTDEFDGLQGIALGDGSLWVAIRDSPDGLARIDPATGEVLHRYPIFASHVVATDDVVWAAGFNSGQIHRIDPRTDEITDDISVPAPISNLLLAEGFLWAANPEDGVLFKISDQGSVSDTFSVPGAWYIGAADGHVWAAGEEERRVDRIEVLTGEQVTFPTGRSVNDLAEGEGQLAVALPWQMADVLATVSGDVLTIGSSFNPFEYTDPAIAGAFGNGIRDRMEQATCAKLLNYPDAPSPEGWELEPEVASAMPEVSADGRTYRFTIRAGYAFSPPSNEPITAETFRFSLERALSSDLGPNAMGIEWLSGIQGAMAFHEGEAGSVSGLVAADDRLTITLDRPDPMLLHKLALPLFCPVPLSTATLLNGVTYPSIPRSGPYYMADNLTGVVTVFKANPNYPGPRVASFDAILWRVHEDAGSLIAQVEKGELDLVTAAEGLEVDGSVDGAWGPDSDAAAAGDQRWFFPPTTAIDAVALNPNDPLLSDPTVREAVGLALDRAELAAVFAGAVATSLMSPAMPASQHTQPIDPEPSIERALALMDGRTGSVNIGVCPFPGCQDWGRTIARQMEGIGISAEIVTVESAEEAGDPSLEIGIANAYGECPCMMPDSVEPLARVLGDVPLGWIPGDVAADVDRLFDLAEPERSRESAELADRLADEGLLLPFAWYGIADYYAERIGCQVASPTSPGIGIVPLCLEDDAPR
jgi:ABC-type transport system substrate-binding protein/class 3 adenylate cyclase/streptogramin lyase